MKLTDDEIRKIAIESGFWSGSSESWWRGAIPAFKVFAMEIEAMSNLIPAPEKMGEEKP